MSAIGELHEAVRRGDLAKMEHLLRSDRSLANARSETDPRGTFPLHVAAQFGHAAAAKKLLDYGADVSLLDRENDSIALGWAAFFGRPGVVDALLAARSDPSQRNKHGLTPLGCAVGGSQGKWQQFSDASLQDWQTCAEAIRAHAGVE
jgi:ankyrin repeat protein